LVTSGNYNTNVKRSFTVIPELHGSLLLRAGEFDQRFQLHDYHPLMSQESAIDFCEAGTLGERAFVFPLQVW